MASENSKIEGTFCPHVWDILKNAAGILHLADLQPRPREHKNWNIHNVFYTLQTIHNVFYLTCLRSSFVDESWRFAQLNSNERLYRIFCMNVVSS